jgi:hypothetical protein
MQMMPKISCPQRVASDAVARTPIVLVVVDIFLPSLLVSYFLISFVISYVARRDARMLQIAPLTKPFVLFVPQPNPAYPQPSAPTDQAMTANRSQLQSF